MLNFGWQRDWFLAHENKLKNRISINSNFSSPPAFTPQREIAVRHFKWLVVTGVTIGLIATVALVAWLASRFAF